MPRNYYTNRDGRTGVQGDIGLMVQNGPPPSYLHINSHDLLYNICIVRPRRGLCWKNNLNYSRQIYNLSKNLES